jgi:hypothetical protein
MAYSTMTSWSKARSGRSSTENQATFSLALLPADCVTSSEFTSAQ